MSWPRRNLWRASGLLKRPTRQYWARRRRSTRWIHAAFRTRGHKIVPPVVIIFDLALWTPNFAAGAEPRLKKNDLRKYGTRRGSAPAAPPLARGSARRRGARRWCLASAGARRYARRPRGTGPPLPAAARATSWCQEPRLRAAAGRRPSPRPRRPQLPQELPQEPPRQNLPAAARRPRRARSALVQGPGR